MSHISSYLHTPLETGSQFWREVLLLVAVVVMMIGILGEVGWD